MTIKHDETIKDQCGCRGCKANRRMGWTMIRNSYVAHGWSQDAAERFADLTHPSVRTPCEEG